MRNIKSLLILPLLMLMVACNSDDSTSSESDHSLILNKIEKFSPSLISYTSGNTESTKRITYYLNNRIVADTLFNSGGLILERTEHIYTSTTHEINLYDPISINLTTKYTFDSLGRIVEMRKQLLNSGSPVNTSTSLQIFIYNVDGSILRKAVDPGTSLIMPQFTIPYLTNPNGFISTITYSPASESTLTYSTDKPTQFHHAYGDGNFINVNFNYYTIQMPSNLIKTTAEINNSILIRGEETAVAANCNYYIKNFIGGSEGPLNFDTTFNEFGYITYSKTIGTIFQEINDSESFYYYN